MEKKNKYSDNEFISAKDLSFPGILHDVKKSRTALQPIFEAFTNALEAIKIKQQSDAQHKGIIIIKIFASETISDSTEFQSLSITDNGIGFNDEEFTRFNTYRATTKGFKNLGSGRIQYVHYFESTHITSIFPQDSFFYERRFILSKVADFINNNAIVKHLSCNKIESKATETTVLFQTLSDNSPTYNELNDSSLKEELLNRYIPYFCHNKNKLPEIRIEFYVQGSIKSKTTISESDIPDIDKSENFNLSYNGSNDYSTEEFKLDAFKISKEKLDKNSLKLFSKGEVIEESPIKLESLMEGDYINENRYLFFVSGDYISSKETNLRGVLDIPSKDSSKTLFTEIFLEDIQEAVNNLIIKLYPEIEEVKQKHEEDILKLKEMFLLDDQTTESMKDYYK